MTEGEKPEAAALEGGRPARGRDRKKGARRNRSLAQKKRYTRRIPKSLQGVAEAFEGNALDLFQMVYKDPRLPDDMRLDAARCALPYESPRLTAIEHSGNIGTLTHEEALAALRAGKPK